MLNWCLHSGPIYFYGMLCAYCSHFLVITLFNNLLKRCSSELVDAKSCERNGLKEFVHNPESLKVTGSDLGTDSFRIPEYLNKASEESVCTL